MSNQPKFKEGDRVKVIATGRIGMIRLTADTGKYKYFVNFESAGWWFSESELEALP